MRKKSVFLAKALAFALTASMSLGVSYVPVFAAETAADVKDTEASTTPKVVDGSAGFWKAFSDDYTLSGDFNVTFKIANEGGSANWNNPLAVITNVPRGGDGYTEYAVVRSDCYGWGTNSGFTYTNSWNNDWNVFLTAIKDATILKNIVRSGNDFYVNDTIIAKDGKEYTSTAKFTADAPSTVNLFLTTDTAKMTIESFSGNVLCAASNYEDGSYLVSADQADCVTKEENGTYSIDLTKFFKESALSGTTTLNMEKIGTVKEATIHFGNNITQKVTFELIAPNPCKEFSVEKEHFKVALNQAFDVAALLKGDGEGRVTELSSAKISDDFKFEKEIIILPDTLTAYLTVEHASLEITSITDNKTATTTTLSAVVGEPNLSTPFRGASSDYITLEKDCDITIDFVNHGNALNWENYLLVLANGKRDTDGYAEYLANRADAWAFDLDKNLSGVKRAIKYDFDWDWADFPTIMKNANVSMNIKRTGNSVIITSKVTPVGSEKTYTYTTTSDYSVAAVASIANAKRDASNKNRIIHTMTPTIAGEGTIEISCGAAGTKTVTYECVENLCSDISGVIGNTGSLTKGQAGSIVVTATGKDADVILNDEVSLVDAVSIKTEEGADTGVYKDKDGIVEFQEYSHTKEAGQTKVVYTVIPKVASSSSITFKCGTKTVEVPIVVSEASRLPETTPVTPPAPDTTPTDPDTTTGGSITTGGGIDTETPGDTNKPDDSNTDNTDNNTSTDNTTDNTDNTTPATKKKAAKLSSVTAKKGKKVVSGKVTIKSSGKAVKNASVKVYVNNKKKASTTTKAAGKFSVKLSKKLKKKDKVKVIVTKSTIKKVTKTVVVK